MHGGGTSSFAAHSVTSLANVPSIIFEDGEPNGPKKNVEPGPGHYEMQVRRVMQIMGG